MKMMTLPGGRKNASDVLTELETKNLPEQGPTH